MATDQLSKIDELKKRSNLIKDGNPARYSLQTTTDLLNQSEPYRKISFGERDKNKPHKIILMVGETGTGKTTLINVMINYMLGVQREDKVWFEITDDQSDRTSVHSQTSRITVYGVYLQESQTDLTIIDTPGYGETHGVENNKEIAAGLHSLSEAEERIQEIDAVCLVINATQNRLSDRKIYIFDAVQSLFGRDIAENIVLLFTHSTGAPPKNALMAVKDAKIKCAENDKKKPVFFLFDNCQSDAADEEDNEEHDQEYNEDHEQRLDKSFNLSFKGMRQFFKFLDTIKPKRLKMTGDVLQQRKQLEAKMSNLQSRVQLTELKQNELKQTQEALEKNKTNYEVDVPYKEKIPINPKVANAAMCCTVCEENCHYPGCWWISGLEHCSMMKDKHCTVCTKRCCYTEHTKGAKIYETKTKKVKRTSEELNKKYDGKKLEKELQELQIEKVKRLFDAFYCVEKLQMIARNADSVSVQCVSYIDFLIEKLDKINEHEKVEYLKNIKKRAGEEKISEIHNK